jgi:glycosyltransferase involved in cell wall biosynthesis
MNPQPLKPLAGARVAIVQPLLAQYRVPVFDLLARTTGLDLTVLCDTKPTGSLTSVAPTDAFRCEHAPLRELGPFVSHPVMLEAANSRRWDAVVLTWNIRLLELVPSLIACRVRRKASVLWGHGYSKHESLLRRGMRRRVVPLADATMVYGRAEQRRLQESGFERIYVAPNAIDQSPIRAAAAAWRSSPERLAQWQRSQGVHDGRVVVFISRIEPDKRVDLLIDAFAIALRSAPDLVLAVIGGGSELAQIQQRTLRLGIADRVRFTGPSYEEATIAPWCLSAACFAYPEAIGLSIQHAFGYGLPVITSDDIPSHNPEIEALRPGVNGLLFRHRDVAAFAGCMLEVLDGSRCREDWAAAAQATVAPPDGVCIEAMVSGFAEAICGALLRAHHR